MIQSKAIWNTILVRLALYHDLGKYPEAQIKEQGFTLTVRFWDGEFSSMCFKNAIGQPEKVLTEYIFMIKDIIDYKLENK